MLVSFGNMSCECEKRGRIYESKEDVNGEKDVRSGNGC